MTNVHKGLDSSRRKFMKLSAATVAAAGFPAPPDDYEADIPGTDRQDVVGPVCESGDFLARGRDMEEALPGDLLAVCTAGAYGFTQASNYNARPRPADRWAPAVAAAFAARLA